jgi:flagellar basal body-associated protein FliL
MSAPAAAPDAAPKKKGKLPIILALALVLGGGGFFMMKGKGKAEKAKPALALAEHETELEEFLTNTANPGVYVRAKLSIRLSKEYTEDKFKAGMGDVRDAVLTVFNSSAPELITDAKRRPELKKQLAEAINTALEGPLEEEAKKGEHKEEEAPKRKGKEKEKSEHKEEDMSDWDSTSGPVLQVRFAALATQ